jgi:hypothetical protein
LDKDDRPLKFKAYLNRDNVNGTLKNRVLIFFDEIITANQAPIKVAVRFEGEVFDYYRRKNWDYFRTHVAVSTNVGEHQWICAISEENDLHATDLANVPEEIRQAVLDDTGGKTLGIDNWVQGKLISANEARDTIKTLFDEDFDADANFIGWKTSRMSSGSSGGFIVHGDDIGKLSAMERDETNDLGNGVAAKLDDDMG